MTLDDPKRQLMLAGLLFKEKESELLTVEYDLLPSSPLNRVDWIGKPAPQL